MTQPKPILTIKQKCRECNETKKQEYEIDDVQGTKLIDCLYCKGTGQQEIEIYVLRDFEKEVFDIREQLSNLEHQQWQYWSKELGKHLEEWKQDLSKSQEV